MGLTREDALLTITERLSWLATACELRGWLHLLNSHTISHNFYCKLLNELYNTKLSVMDQIHTNFPAIDLGDSVNKLSFQITSDKSSEKIQTTLEKYVDHGLDSIYGKIRVVVFGKKQKSYSGVKIPKALDFEPAKDIVDTKDLLKMIDSLDTEKLLRIEKVVKEEIAISDLPAKLFHHVTAYNESPKYWSGSANARMQYVAEFSNGELTINPVMPYLTILETGGPIEPLRYITRTYCPFDWGLPVLDFKFQNRSNSPFFLAEAVVEVENSDLDIRPLIVVREDTFGNFARNFCVVNEGPTPLSDVKIQYTLLPGDVPIPEVFPEHLPFIGTLDILEDELYCDITGEFNKCGADLDGLEALHVAVQAQQQATDQAPDSSGTNIFSREAIQQEIKRCLGPFQDEVGTVIGRISFKESSTSQYYEVKFRVPVFIFNEHRKGLPKPPSAVYQFELEAIGQNYKRHIPNFSFEVEPNMLERFLVTIEVKKPSFHKFRVVFRSVDNQLIQSSWIRLRCFLPRTRRDRATIGEAIFEKPLPWNATDED